MRFYTVHQLSARKSLTPEGYLLCEGSVLARLGVQNYAPEELQYDAADAADDGYIHVHREPEEVFAPASMASYAGKPVVLDHPDEDVTPETWPQLAVGVVMNPRRGEGADEDVLLGDLLITRADAIERIQGQQSSQELSCGYDANYEMLSRGEAKQVQIIGNHVAFVDRGRCGPRCAIRDHAHAAEGVTMSKTLWDRIRAAIKSKDEAGAEAAIKEAEEKEKEKETKDFHVHIHQGSGGMDDDPEAALAPGRTKPEGGLPGTGDPKVASSADEHSYDKMFKDYGERIGGLEKGMTEIKDSLNKIMGAQPPGTGDKEPPEEKDPAQGGVKEIEGELEEEAPEGTGDKARSSKDSAYMADSFSETVSLAEILAPGIRVPTYDQALDPRRTLLAVAKLRRDALRAAMLTRDGMELVQTFTGGREPDLDKMSLAKMRAVFKGAAQLKKARNQDATRGGTRLVEVSRETNGNRGPLTISELNALNAKHYADSARNGR